MRRNEWNPNWNLKSLKITEVAQGGDKKNSAEQFIVQQVGDPRVKKKDQKSKLTLKTGREDRAGTDFSSSSSSSSFPSVHPDVHVSSSSIINNEVISL
jgi:hypothetical protein